MEDNENLDGKEETSTAKVVTGIRMPPGLKEALINEAYEAGFTVSEYGETILYNRHEENKEVERLSQLAKQQQAKIETLEGQMAVNNAKQSEAISAEIVELRKIIEQQKELLAIYSDKRLLYLYESMKGKKDKVLNAYGDDFNIVYDTPYQVLLALIYTSKLNN